MPCFHSTHDVTHTFCGAIGESWQRGYSRDHLQDGGRGREPGVSMFLPTGRGLKCMRRSAHSAPFGNLAFWPQFDLALYSGAAKADRNHAAEIWQRTQKTRTILPSCVADFFFT